MSRPLTYPRRGLHGEVVHTIGMQIVNGTPEPATPSARGRAHRGSLGQPHRRPRGRPRSRRQGARRGEAEDRDARPAEDGLEHPRPGRPQLAERGGARPEALRGDDRDPARDRAARGPARRDARDARAGRRHRGGIRGHGGRGRRPARIPRGGPPVPRPHPLLVRQRAPRAPGRVLRAVLRATFTLTTTPSGSRRRALPLHRAILEGIQARDEDAAEIAARTLIADTAADIRRLAPRGAARRR